jgi:choline dehydrogenase-like flavoprotein
LEIWTNATACEFDLDCSGGRVVGVRARAHERRALRVRADEFVIAAGTVETTRLLLLLDRSSSHHAFRDCAVLGRCFQEHLKMDIGELSPIDAKSANFLFGYRIRNATHRSLYFQLTPEVQESERIASAFLTVRFELPQDSPLDRIRNIARGRQRGLACQWRDAIRIVAAPAFLAGVAHWRFRHRLVFLPRGTRFIPEIRIEQVPDWKNRIILSDQRDQLGMPMVKVEWEATLMEERTFRTSVERVAGYWTRTGLSRLCPVKWNESSRDPSKSLVDQSQKTWHPSGSTRMGKNPAESVVDPRLRCHAIPNVRVVSASTFPSAGSTNPTLTILQLAFRASESMLLQK